MKLMATLFLPLTALFLSAGCVMQQDVVILENRISALEMDNVRRRAGEKEANLKIARIMGKMEEAFKTNGKTSREKYADFKTAMDAVKNEIRLIKGRLEESEHRLVQQGMTMETTEKQGLERLDAAVTKNYQRLVRLEKYMGFEPSELLTGQVAKTSESADLELGESALYQSAKALLDSGNFEGARTRFDGFIQRFPESENVDNARFWIADSYYREKWFEKAILEYQIVIEKYPKGNKVSAALLKQGYAFASLGEKANARLILKELIKKHPDAREAGIARDKLKSLR